MSRGLDALADLWAEAHEASHHRLVELRRAEALRLLEAQRVGRLVWLGPEGPTAVPVNHRLDGERILLRTSAYSSIARECDDLDVAFEVDHVDPTLQSGWSVLVRGRAHILYPSDHDAPAQRSPEPWPEGPRPLFVSIDVRDVSGRRLG